MKKHRTGLAVVLFSLVAFGVASADIEFNGVLHVGTTLTRIDSVALRSPDKVFFTLGWGSHPPTDTYVFTGVAAWPESLRMHGTINGFPLVLRIEEPVGDSSYSDMGMSIRVMFYGDYGVEESKHGTAPLPRLAVSPSVVTGQMTVRLQPVGTGRSVVEIHDAVGNVVRSLDCTVGADGIATATWNREDEFGQLVPEGVYFCRYAGADVIAVRKVIVSR